MLRTVADQAALPADDRSPARREMDLRDAVRETSDARVAALHAGCRLPEDRLWVGIVQPADHGFHEEGHPTGMGAADSKRLRRSRHGRALLNHRRCHILYDR